MRCASPITLPRAYPPNLLPHLLQRHNSSRPRCISINGRALRETLEPATQRELIAHAHATLHELAPDTHAVENPRTQETANALIALLVQLRVQLRATKHYALADFICQSLSDVGIVLEDTPAGTSWKRQATQ